MNIKMLNKSKNSIPSYATKGSSGMDLKAFIKNKTKKCIIYPMKRKMIHTGLFIELPIGYEAQIRPRSGLAYHYGITVLNFPGTIDSDYRGEIKVLLINLSNNSFIIKNGDKIAQMIIFAYEKIDWLVEEDGYYSSLVRKNKKKYYYK